MTDKLELAHGSGNVFRDFGRRHADVERAYNRAARQEEQDWPSGERTTSCSRTVKGYQPTDLTRHEPGLRQHRKSSRWHCRS